MAEIKKISPLEMLELRQHVAEKLEEWGYEQDYGETSLASLEVELGVRHTEDNSVSYRFVLYAQEREPLDDEEE